jgi:hypothetical protein
MYKILNKYTKAIKSFKSIYYKLWQSNHTLIRGVLFSLPISRYCQNSSSRIRKLRVIRIKCFRLDFRPFLRQFFPLLMLTADVISSVLILRLSRIWWSICSLTSTYVTVNDCPEHVPSTPVRPLLDLCIIRKLSSVSHNSPHTERSFFNKCH